MKKEKIRSLALPYYARKDVLEAIFNFSNKREVAPRYFDSFGKRPDSFQYPSDILALVKKGASSFHCSEERWQDPLQLKTGMPESELNNLREGWDLIIDIDCNWIDYSKKAAVAIIKALEYRGVKNMAVKFSGNKGFHIIVPWEAFPEEINGIKTSAMFPEWPKAITGYIKELSRPILEDLMKESEADFLKVKGYFGVKCEKCNNLADARFEVTVRCDKCSPPHIETFKTSNENYREKKCPIHTKSELKEVSKKKFYYCSRCSIDSLESKSSFSERISIDIFKVLGLDLQLVSPRHLFRMPYSLHEKTALASIVLDKNKISEFEINDADPLKVVVKDFIPKVKKNEAKDLLLSSIDWYSSQKKEKEIDYSQIDKKDGAFEMPKIKIKDDYFPPIIQKILKGMNDGKKRALFILLNFFRSLGFPIEEVEEKIKKWNSRNNPPLKEGYIKAQLMWHARHHPVMPPNFDNEIYKEIGVFDTDNLTEKIKNPVAYVIAREKIDKKINKKTEDRIKTGKQNNFGKNIKK
ncbi:hypothetical protein J4477_04340 [Candidatus Pacearchaeota archaeon]|nr:hypothetical protein [Candidatus Pacearchaeota archaeon]